MTSRAARTLRGVAFALLAVLLAAAAHTLAGGGAPSALFCAVAVVLATPLSVVAAGPRMRRWRTVAAVAASQAVFHVAFTVVGDLGRWDAAAGPHAHGPEIVLSGAEGVSVVPPIMLLAHAAAAAVTAAAVLFGERGVRTVWRWADVRLRRATAAVRVPVLRRIPETPHPVLAPRAPIAAHPARRRGPPVLSAVV